MRTSRSRVAIAVVVASFVGLGGYAIAAGGSSPPSGPTTTIADSEMSSPLIDVSTPERGQAAPAGFAEDLATSKAIIKTAIGRSCDVGDATWLRDRSSPQPKIVAVAGTDVEGNCSVVGWAYRASDVVYGFELPITPSGYILQPIFDESGRLIKYFPAGEDVELPDGPGI